MPKVSIIMPIYNSEKYITSSIKSILNQTFTDWELIIVDDCSRDRSLELIDKLQTEKMIVLKNQKHLGAAETRNRAIDIASGTYIAFIDSDDIWKKEKLEKQIEMMEKEDDAFLFSSYERINEKGEIIGKVDAPQVVCFEDLLRSTPIQISTVLLNMQKINKVLLHMPQVKTCEDVGMYLQILNTGIKAKGMQEYLAQYKVRKNSLSSNKVLNTIRRWNLYKKYHIKLKDRWINIIKHIKNSVLRCVW